MKKNKLLIAATVFVAVAIAAIITVMFATGKFNSLKNNFGDETTAAEPSTTEQQELPAQGRPKTSAPDSIVAAFYDSYSENSSSELSNLQNFGFNTVIFSLTEENGAEVSALFDFAKQNKLMFGVRADISNGSDYAAEFAEKFNFDFIIFGGADETLSEYYETTDKLCEKIKKADPAMQIGIEPIYCSKASKSVTELVSGGKADFVFLFQGKDKNSVFETAQSVWNEKTCPLWLCHNLSGLSSFSTDSAASSVALISHSAEMPLCKALAFAPYSDISKASGTGAEIVLNYIKKRDTYLLDKDFSLTSHKSTNITVEQPTITFRGTSSPAYDLLCNGKKLTVAKNGDFSVDCSLNPGKNTIKFEHKGKTYNYTVTYKIKLLKSVSPSEDISVPGGMMIEVTAVALKSASLSVSFNGKTYAMTAVSGSGGSQDNAPDAASDFATFTASLNTPQSTSSVQKLGKFTVTAKYDSLSESLKGASVTVTAKEVVTAPPATQKPTTTETTQKPTVPASSGSVSETDKISETHTETALPPSDGMQKYYYTENYGLGAAKICVITDDYVEVYPGNTTSTFSVPDCSPLLKGTVDYVVSSAKYDGDTYYILASGVKVPLLREERLASGENGKITHLSIKDGYVMPKNNIRVVSSKVSNGKTVIVLEMNRTVAFNAKLLGQTYGLYNNRPVTVSSLNCTGLEFTFSDTETARGDISLSGSVCKSAAWSSDKSNSSVTLTLELAEKGKFYGFHYEYNDEGNLVITVNHKPSSSLSGYTIMLDPGHGGLDSGAVCAVSAADLNLEKYINLSIATKVKELLEAEGAKVIMTRTSDKWVCYADRNGAVRTHNPDMFISIHCDSSSAASAMGTSAYYYRAYSQPLAKAIHKSIVEAYKAEIYKDKPSDFMSKISRGANFYAFRVIRVEECPAILIEYGFVSNTEECQVLQSAANRDILAAATVKGIKNYISAS